MRSALTLQQAFDLANQRHNAGRLGEAEAIYRQILSAQPNQPDALHGLGIIAMQVGKLDLAVNLLSQAVAAAPAAPHFRSNLGLALTQVGRLDEAIDTLRQAVQLQPDLADAQNNLGNALRRAGRIDEAIAALRYAIGFNPRSAEAHCNLASCLRATGKFADAESEYRKALQINPNVPQAYVGLGTILSLREQIAPAIEMFRTAVRLGANWPEVHHNLGNLFRETGRLDEAAAAYRTAIALKPDFAESHNNLGITLRLQGRTDEAIAAFQKALELNPTMAGGFSNLGNVLKENGRVDDAIAAYEQAIKLDPDMFEAYTNLGNSLKAAGELEAAIQLHRQAVERGPQFPKLYSNLIYSLYFHPDYTQQQIHAEELEWADRHATPLKQYIRVHDNDRNPDRKLRIGYVSPDFRTHCQAFFTVPLLRNHDRQQFHITCYNSALRTDAVSDELRKLSDQWRDIGGLFDHDAAEIVRNDKIDILIDLTLHMAGHRLLIFAEKPALVQVTWLGYPGSTGLDTIDYRITDPYLDPPGTDESVYTEKPYRLPDTFWCFDPLTDVPSVNELPASKNGCVTFGCLNNFAKANRGVLELWARVLRDVPGSRMIILAQRSRQRERTIETLEGLGVDRGRIQFEDPRPRIPYLELYQTIDISLDTFPYNGHTTSLDSLWMGVPVVSLVGNTPVARAGLTLLMNVGLKELAVNSPDEYVSAASALASDLKRLTAIRQTLRTTMQASPLMDSARFARDFESALREMWRTWCREKSAATTAR
jgi:predicted O-linked N-acetylglucosamine transferase (SPINDLY family)